jgi:hypothetical protein
MELNEEVDFKYLIKKAHSLNTILAEMWESVKDVQSKYRIDLRLLEFTNKNFSNYDELTKLIEQTLNQVNDKHELCSLIQQMENVHARLSYIHGLKMNNEPFDIAKYFLDNLDYIEQLPVSINLYRAILLKDNDLFDKSYKKLYHVLKTDPFPLFETDDIDDQLDIFWMAMCYTLSVDLVNNYYELTNKHSHRLKYLPRDNTYIDKTIDKITNDHNISPKEYDLYIRFLTREFECCVTYILKDNPKCNLKLGYALELCKELIFELSAVNLGRTDEIIESIEIPNIKNE